MSERPVLLVVKTEDDLEVLSLRPFMAAILFCVITFWTPLAMLVYWTVLR